MIIYIAGPITGNENYSKDFANAEKILSANGRNTVLNPAILPTGLSWEECMPVCFAMLDICDAVYFLEGWEHSRGARLEFERATKRGMRLIFEERSKSKCL